MLTTREPGGTRIGDGIRQLLLDLAHTEMNARRRNPALQRRPRPDRRRGNPPRPRRRQHRPLRSLRRQHPRLPGLRPPAGHRRTGAPHRIRNRRPPSRPDHLPRYPARRRHPPQPRPRRRRLEPPRRPGAILLSTCSERLSPADSTAAAALDRHRRQPLPRPNPSRHRARPAAKAAPPSRPTDETCPRMRPIPKGLTILQLAKQWPNSSI